jgi:hypothetical protein
MATYLIGPTQPVGRRTVADANSLTGIMHPGDFVFFEPGTYTGNLFAAKGVYYSCVVDDQYFTLANGTLAVDDNCTVDHFKLDGSGGTSSAAVAPVGSVDGAKNVTLSNYEIKNFSSYAIRNDQGQWNSTTQDDSGWLMVNGYHSNNGSTTTYDTLINGSNCIFRNVTWENLGFSRSPIRIVGRGTRVEDTCVFRGCDGILVQAGNVVISGEFIGCFKVMNWSSQDASGLGGEVCVVNVIADGQSVMNHIADLSTTTQPDGSALAPVRFVFANITAINPDPINGNGLFIKNMTNASRFVRVRNCAFGPGFQDNGIEGAYNATYGSVDYCFFQRSQAINTTKEGVHSFKADDIKINATTYLPLGDSPLLRAGTNSVGYSDQANALEVQPRVPDVGWMGVLAPPAPPLPLDLTPPRSWSFWLATCTPDVNIEDQIIGQFTQSTDRTLTLGLNSPGSASFTVDMSDPLVSQMEAIRTCLVAICDGIVQWSGPIWTLNEQLPERKIAVTAVGWLELLNHRLVRPKKNSGNAVTVGLPAGQGSTADYIPFNDPTANVGGWSAADPFVIRTLLSLINGKNEYINHEFGWDTGIRWFDATLDSGGVDFAEQYSTPWFYGITDAKLTHTWRVNRFQNFGQQIMQIVNLEGGLDIWIDPNTRRMHYQTRTNDDLSAVYNEYTLNLAITHKPAQTFAYGVGPHNLANLRRTTDPSWMTNWFTAVGKYNDFFVSDTDSVTHFGQVFDTDESISVSPATSDQEISTLPLYAGAEVAVRSFPRVIYELTPMGTRSFSTPRLTEVAIYDSDTGGTVGSPFSGGALLYQGGDLRIGDWVSLQARAGTVVIDQLVRVYGATINIDDAGVEKLASIQTSYQASS